MRYRLFTCLFASLIAFLAVPSGAAERLDTSLKPDDAGSEDVGSIFRDMVVVQRKAKNKAGRALFYSYGSFDFSDGPTTMYGLNLDLGYAMSDHWEVYLNAVPAFITSERDVAKRVRSLTLLNGDRAEISYSKPKAQYGLEILWAPAYGKDSWGPYSIVRSDTFFKLGLGAIQYDADVGQRYNLTIGKTFFLSRFFNLRASAGGSYLQTVVQERKTFYFVGIIETGVVWYL